MFICKVFSTFYSCYTSHNFKNRKLKLGNLTAHYKSKIIILRITGNIDKKNKKI